MGNNNFLQFNAIVNYMTLPYDMRHIISRKPCFGAYFKVPTSYLSSLHITQQCIYLLTSLFMSMSHCN